MPTKYLLKMLIQLLNNASKEGAGLTVM